MIFLSVEAFICAEFNDVKHKIPTASRCMQETIGYMMRSFGEYPFIAGELHLWKALFEKKAGNYSRPFNEVFIRELTHLVVLRACPFSFSPSALCTSFAVRE